MLTESDKHESGPVAIASQIAWVARPQCVSMEEYQPASKTQWYKGIRMGATASIRQLRWSWSPRGWGKWHCNKKEVYLRLMTSMRKDMRSNKRQGVSAWTLIQRHGIHNRFNCIAVCCCCCCFSGRPATASDRDQTCLFTAFDPSEGMFIKIQGTALLPLSAVWQHNVHSASEDIFTFER